MLRQARELFALPAGNKKTANKTTSTKEKPDKRTKKVDKESAKLKVPKQLYNDESNKTLAPDTTAFCSATESMLHDHLEANISHRKRQNHSSSSGGSSSGYLSQAVGFQSQGNAEDATIIDHVAYGTQNGASGGKPASSSISRQNGSYRLQQHQHQRHQSEQPLSSTQRSMMDVRLQHQLNGRQYHFQHLRAPTMVPMMIDDGDGDGDGDDDDDDDDDGQPAVEDLDDENDDEENLDVRQMLASHRERLQASTGDHPDYHRHTAHYGGLIDGVLPKSTTADKLSHPTYGEARRSLAHAQTPMSMVPHHQQQHQHHDHYQQHANSDADDHHGFNRQSFQPTDTRAATFGRPQHYRHHQEQPVSYLYSGQQSLGHHHHLQSSRQQYLKRLPDQPQNHHLHNQHHQQQQQQQQRNTATIYYKPNLINSEHRYQHQQQQTYEHPRYLQTSSSFLYHQPNASQQFTSRRPHQLGAAHKPVPPLPPASRQRSSTASYAPTNGQLNGHLNQLQHQKAASKMMQTSGSRQHLTTSSEQQQPQHHSSSASSSPHARRNNHKQQATLHGASSQLSIAKQNLRSVPNRSTPTPTHVLARANGPPAGQMLPNAGLSGELAPPPMSCCGKMAKFLLFIANALFWAAGMALGAWGILGLVDDHKYNLSQLLVFEPSTRMSLFQLLSWSFITLGCATILVGVCGCSAMFKNSRWILGLYIFLILAIFALDLATGLLAIIFQERLVANVRLRLVNKLRIEYGIQASFTAAVDYIQTRYECCGLDGHFDYDQSLWRLQRLGGFEATVARTCCHLRNTFDDQAHVNPRPVNESMCQSTDVRFHQSYRYRRGCLDDLERLIRHKIWTFTIGCGAVGAIILVSLVFATCFCRSIPNTSGSRKSSAATATGSRVYHQQAAYLETTNAKKAKHSSHR